MRAVLPVTALLVVVAAFAPSGLGQAHDHGSNASGVVIAHDVPASGRTYVGNINHFAILDLGKGDLVPDFHQQNHVRVTWNGLVLYETTPDSGHDYDGVHAFDVVFPGPGDYEVAALDDAGKVLNMFMGTVVEPKAGSGAELQLEGPTEVDAGEPSTFTFSTVGTPAIVPHSDAIFEVRQGSSLLFRTKTHTHEAAQQVEYAFPLPGTYTVRVTNFLSFPSGNEANDFAPSVAQMEVTATVSPGVSALPPATAAPPAAMNAVVAGTTTGGNYTFVGTYDPYTVVGTGTLQHLSTLVMDPGTGEPVQHVDFTATLRGPTGRVFSSQSLHEYDGIFEVAAVGPVPGVYVLVVDATRGDWKGHLEMPYVVAPPVEPVALDVPPQPPAIRATVTAAGLEGAKAGAPIAVTLQARGMMGQPIPHSEIDVQVLGASGVPLLATKLHTHSDGDFPFTLLVPEAGMYTLRLSPFPLDPQAMVSLGAVDIPFEAGAGQPLPVGNGAQEDVDAQANDAPLPWALALLALAIGALAMRRR